MHARQIAPGNRQVTRLLGAPGEHHGIELGEQRLRVYRLARITADAGWRRLRADVNAGAELHALGAQLVEAPVDHALVELEVGNAIAQETADAVAFFEHRDLVAGARQLLRAGEACRSGADDGDAPTGRMDGALRAHPAFFPRLVGDGVLDRLDADRIVVDAQHARLFARCRTDATGELREIVRRVQHLDRLLPVLPINEIVPVGNDVVDRATALAEGNAAIHAARALQAGGVVGKPQVELAVVLLARLRGFVGLLEPLVLEEPGDLAHYAAALARCAASSPRARRYSFGNTLTKRGRYCAQLARMSAA